MSSDFRLYRNDPDAETSVATSEEYVPGQFSWYLSVEGGLIAQHLANPDEFGSTEEQVGYAGAVQFRLKYGYFRAHATGFLRNASYLLTTCPRSSPSSRSRARA